MRINKRKQKRRHVFIAMADIAFLLLVFLIVTSSINSEGNIVLPVFSYTGKSGFADPLSVVISIEGDVWLNSVLVGRKQLVKELSELAPSEKKVVHVSADRDTEYSNVDDILSLLREAELYRIILIADKNDEE